MIAESRLTERQLIEQLVSALQELPDVHATLKELEHAGTLRRRHDAEIDLRIGGKDFTLLIEVKKAIYPRDVREVLWQLKEYAADTHPSGCNDETVLLLVAELISPGARELLRQERVGYYDSGGSLFLPARGAFLYIDKPPSKTLAKSVRSLFSGRRSQVLHTLLIHHGDWFSVKELSEQAKVSPATASQVLTELDRFDWVASRGQGPSKERHLIEPAALLDAWAKQLVSSRAPAMRRYYVPSIGAENLVSRIAHICKEHSVEYGVTHEAAAQRYARFLSSISQVRCRLFAGPAADAAIRDLSARVVNEGANLVIMEAQSHGDFLFRKLVGNAWLASPVQVYLDLLRGEGRSREMAEHLRKEVIGF